MIDIHCHMLFGVDDGADSLEESVKLLADARKQGVTDVILTPHLRHGMFHYDRALVDRNFQSLLPYAEKIGIHLYLGCEYHVNTEIMDAYGNGKFHSLADRKYILTEYSSASEYSFVVKMTQEIIRHGFVPVIAHVERYGCLREEIERVAELQDMGAWIQINADAVLGLEGRGTKKFCKELLEEEWVDVIASDTHDLKKRACHMEKCFSYIGKKYGADYARELMEQKPAQIIGK